MKTIDLSEIARLMLKWERAKQYLDELEEAIKDSVLQVGETQTTGNVKATYSGGRKTYDYRAAAKATPPETELVEAHTKVTENVDWRSLCKAAGITDVPFTRSPPSVTVKLR